MVFPWGMLQARMQSYEYKMLCLGRDRGWGETSSFQGSTGFCDILVSVDMEKLEILH